MLTKTLNHRLQRILQNKNATSLTAAPTWRGWSTLSDMLMASRRSFCSVSSLQLNSLIRLRAISEHDKQFKMNTRPTQVRIAGTDPLNKNRYRYQINWQSPKMPDQLTPECRALTSIETKSGELCTKLINYAINHHNIILSKRTTWGKLLTV